MKLFDDSNNAASLVGPKQSILFLIRISISPFASGASGPTTTKSILFDLQYDTISLLSVSYTHLTLPTILRV